MNFNDLFQKEYNKLDMFFTKACRVFGYFFFIIWVLNEIGVYIVSHTPMNIVLIITFVMMFIPTIMFRFMKNVERTRFFAVSILIIQIGLMYSILTFHVLLLFLFPVILVSPYGSKKLNIFTICMSCVSMTVSHILSYYLSVIPEEPFVSMRDILVYGLTPRLIEFMLFVMVLNFITKRNSNMLNRVFKYSNDMYATQAEVVRSFAEISESKSGQTGAHVKRVAKYMDVMAKQLGIEEQERESLVIASMMHDIGKLMIAPEIIEKPGKLTPEEYEEVKKHTDIGYHLLEHSPGHVMEIAKKIAFEHHERWDGNGYHGISGGDIDYYSRIMSIVDVFDALISKRSYKEKWTTDEAYAEIVSQAGRQFDPHLVETFKICYPDFVEIAKKLPDKE